MLKGIIVGQRLAIQKSTIVADTINYLTAQFIFKTEDWAELEKWAHFRQGETVYDVKLAEDAIPAAGGLNLPAGRWELYLHGSCYENGQVVRRITTQPVAFTVKESGCLEGEVLPVTPASLGEQLEARIQSLEQRESAGTTFIPSVSEDGILSWSNDGGLENPEPVDLAGYTATELDEKLKTKIPYEAMSYGSFTITADLSSFVTSMMLATLAGDHPDYKFWIKNTVDGYYYHCSLNDFLDSFSGGTALQPAETLPPWASVLKDKTAETWNFTLEDGSVITKQVVVG